MKNKKILKTVLTIIAFIIIIAGTYLISHWMQYENPETIKAEVKDYLSKSYKIDFVITEPEFIGNAWQVYANPANGQKTDTFLQWKKGATPHIVYDSYISDRLRLQAFPEAELFFKTLYGEDAQIFFLFQCMDDEFLKSEEAKTIDIEDEVKQQKQNNYMEAQCYVFQDKKPERAVEIRDAKKSINEYFNQMASEWVFEVFYLPDNYKEEFNQGFSRDFNFLRARDSTDYIKMHNNGQILDYFMLMRIKGEPSPDINYINGAFLFDNQR